MIRGKLTILDAMILIASLAVAIAWSRALVTQFQERDAFDSTLWPRLPWKVRLTEWPSIAVPWLMTGSLGIWILRMRSPRPPLSALARQPGAAACFVALVSGALQAGLMILGIALSHIPGMTNHRPGTGPDVGVVTFWLTTDLTDVGYSVMGAWLILAAGRLWEAEPSLIDRSGRLLGMGWIAILVAHRVGSHIIN